MELTAGGRVRRFALHPPRSRSSSGTPLVIVLHGNHPDATGLMMRDWTTFDEQADAFGFAVAYPDGVGGARVAVWTVFGGGHTWPGARSFPGAAETGPREFDAAEEICRFAGPLLAPAQSRRL
jgi:poly(3-hydroxybutyrate) depolymerase